MKCMDWAGAKNRKGYGQKRINGILKLVHRLAFQKATGIDPKGKMVLHKCDNPSCVNPKHLFLGDAFTNMQDMSKKKRSFNQKKTHCPKGHPYDVWLPKTKERRCRVCKNAYLRWWRDKFGRSDRP